MVFPRRRASIAKFALQLGARDGIERAEGLVHQKDGGVGSEGSRDAYSLTLAARKLGGPTMGEFGRLKADEMEQLIDAGIQPGRVPIFKSGDEANIFGDGEMRKQTGVLNDVTDVRGAGESGPSPRWLCPPRGPVRRTALACG